MSESAARSFLESVANYADAERAETPSQDRPIRIATVDAAYNGTGNPMVLFDGESLMGVRKYPWVNVKPAAGNRVVMVPQGHAYVIAGILGLNDLVKTNDSRLSDARTPTAHNHDASDIDAGVFSDARMPARLATTSQSITGMDLNTLESTGWYRGQNLDNGPSGGDSKWWYVEVQRHDASYVHQTAIGLSGSNIGEVYRRNQNAGSWMGWVRSHAYAVAGGNWGNGASIANGASISLTVTFPSGRFSVAPLITLGSSSTRLSLQADTITSTSFRYFVANFSGASAAPPHDFRWHAEQMTSGAAGG